MVYFLFFLKLILNILITFDSALCVVLYRSFHSFFIGVFFDTSGRENCRLCFYYHTPLFSLPSGFFFFETFNTRFVIIGLIITLISDYRLNRQPSCTSVSPLVFIGVTYHHEFYIYLSFFFTWDLVRPLKAHNTPKMLDSTTPKNSSSPNLSS